MNAIKQMFGKLETSPDNKPRRVPRADRFGIAVHHTKGKGSPAAMAKYKADTTVGHTYHFHIHQVGRARRWTVHQCWPLDVALPHAGDHNLGRWAICVTGNFDEEPFPDEVVWLVSEISALLCLWRDWRRPHEIAFAAGRHGRKIDGPRVAGHRELLWSTSKVNRTTGRPLAIKTCPGSQVDMKSLRDMTLRHILSRGHYSPDDAARELLDAGVLLAAPGVI